MPGLRAAVADPRFSELPPDAQRELAAKYEPGIADLPEVAQDSILTRLAPDPYAFNEKRQGLPPNSLKALQEQENRGLNPNAKSPTGVRGLMQITGATARQYGLPDELHMDPAAQITTAARILGHHYGLTGDLAKAYAKYGDPNQKGYADEVMKRYARMGGALPTPTATDLQGAPTAADQADEALSPKAAMLRRLRGQKPPEALSPTEQVMAKVGEPIGRALEAPGRAIRAVEKPFEQAGETAGEAVARTAEPYVGPKVARGAGWVTQQGVSSLPWIAAGALTGGEAPAAAGLGGVLERMGIQGATMAGASMAEEPSRAEEDARPIDALAAAKRGAIGGAAGQLVVGEPLRALGRLLGSRGAPAEAPVQGEGPTEVGAGAVPEEPAFVAGDDLSQQDRTGTTEEERFQNARNITPRREVTGGPVVRALPEPAPGEPTAPVETREAPGGGQMVEPAPPAAPAGSEAPVTALPEELEAVFTGNARAFLRPPMEEGTVSTPGEQALAGQDLEGLAAGQGAGHFRGKDGTEVVYDPRQVTERALQDLDAQGKLAEVVNGPGTAPKPEAPTTAVTVRTPSGAEARTILTETPEQTDQAIAAQPPGHTTEVRPAAEAIPATLAERQGITPAQEAMGRLRTAVGAPQPEEFQVPPPVTQEPRVATGFDPSDPVASARYLLKDKTWEPTPLLTREQRTALEQTPAGQVKLAAYENSMFRRNNWQQPLFLLSDTAGDVLPPKRAAFYQAEAKRLDAAATAAGTFEGKPMPPELVKDLHRTVESFEREATGGAPPTAPEPARTEPPPQKTARAPGPSRAQRVALTELADAERAATEGVNKAGEPISRAMQESARTQAARLRGQLADAGVPIPEDLAGAVARLRGRTAAVRGMERPAPLEGLDPKLREEMRAHQEAVDARAPETEPSAREALDRLQGRLREKPPVSAPALERLVKSIDAERQRLGLDPSTEGRRLLEAARLRSRVGRVRGEAPEGGFSTDPAIRQAEVNLIEAMRRVRAAKPYSKDARLSEEQLTRAQAALAHARGQEGVYAEDAAHREGVPDWLNEAVDRLGAWSKKGEPGERGSFSMKPKTPEPTGAVKAILNHIRYGDAPKGPLSERVPVAAHRLYEFAIDRTHPIQQMMTNLRRAGVTLPANLDPAILVRLLPGWSGKAEVFIQHSPMDYATSAPIDGPSLADALGDMKGDVRRFDAYLAARATQDLVRAGKKTKISAQAADRAVAELEAEMAPHAALYDQVMDGVFRYLRDSGTMSGAGYDAAKAVHLGYAPLWRAAETSEARKSGSGQRFVNLYNPVKKAGEEAAVGEYGSPTENSVRNVYALVNIAERNRVGQAIAGIADLPGGKDYIREVTGPQGTPKIAKTQADAETGVDVPEEVAGALKPSSALPKDRNIIRVFFDGKPRYFEVSDDLHRAIENMDGGQVDALIEMLRPATSLVRAGATMVPDFALVKNPFRDQFSALAQSPYGYAWGVDWLRGIAALGLTKDRSPLFWQAMASGASRSSLVSMDRPYLERTVHELTGAPLGIKERLLTPLRGLQAASEATEAATRLSVFRRGVQAEGDTPEGRAKAAMAYREATVDFPRRGSGTQIPIALIPFFNPSFQGPDQFARSVKARPAATLLKVFSSITLPSLALWLYAHNDPRYQAATPQERDRFWIVPTPWREQPYRFPKPPDIGTAFGSSVERALDFWQTHDPRGLEQWAKQTADILLPDYMPAMANPLYENQINESRYTGSPVVPSSLQRVEPRFQYTDQTSEIAKRVGDALNMSPLKIDHLIYGYSAGMGALASRGASEALRRMTGAPDTSPAWTPADIPVAGATAMRYPSAHADQIERFYEKYNSAQEKYATFQALQKEHPEQVADYARKHAAEIELQGPLQETAGQLGELRNAAKMLAESPQLTPKQRQVARDEIYRMMIQVADQVTRGLEGRPMQTEHSPSEYTPEKP